MRRYRFGDFVLEVRQRRTRRADGTVVALTPRLHDALQFFVEHPGELLDKETLFTALWPGVVVEENSLSQTISALRRALGDDAQASRYIQTVPRRGFRFIAEVVVEDDDVAVNEALPVVVSSAAVTDAPSAAAAAAPAAATPVVGSAPSDESAGEARAAPHPNRRAVVAGIGAAAVMAAVAVAWRRRPAPPAAPAVAAAGMPVAPTSLAILPFKPLVADARNEVLELGMADSLITRLSSLPGIAVRSIGSVRSYAGPDQDPMRAAAALQVQWVVDGTIQRWGDQVRVTARLLNAANGEAAWSGNFDEAFTGVFALQDAISARVSAVLAPHLGSEARKRLAGAGGTRNIDAYQIYLAARHQAQGIRNAGLIRSIALYRQAIALDPGYALAYAGLAESNRRMIFGADAEPRIVFENAKRDAQRAIDIDPGLAEGHSSMGWNRFWYDWDWAGAEATYRHAIALNPSEVNAHFGLGQLLTTLRRERESVAEMQVARELDPQSLILLTLESGVLYGSGKVEEGRRRLQRVFDIEPDFWVAHLTLGAMLASERRLDEAVVEMERADRLADGSSQAAAALGNLLARNGRVVEARRLLDRFADTAATRYVPPTSFGLIHAGLGDREAAIGALQRGFDVRDARMTLVPGDGRWTPVRGDPRYAAIVRRMGLAT